MKTINLHKSQILFYLLSAFILGVFISSIYSISLTWVLVGLLIAIISLGAVAYHRADGEDERKIYQKKITVVIVFSALFFLLGMGYYTKFNLSHSFVRDLSNTNINVTLLGYVDGESQLQGQSQRYVFRVKRIVLPDYGASTDEKILVTDQPYPKRNYGEQLSINGRLKYPTGLDSENSINYLKNQGVTGTISFPEIKDNPKPNVSLVERIKITVYTWIYKIKYLFESSIQTAMPEPNSSFVAGILLGSRQTITLELKDAFNKTGTTHILAISGYNIAIISVYLLLILVVLVKRRTAFWISVAGIIVFTILTGASASVVRAAIMGILLSFANGYGRLYDQKISITLAAFLMIIINPFVLVLDVGFQFSFLSVFGIAYLYPVIRDKLSVIKGPEIIRDTLLMTLSAQIFVLPLAAYYFGNFSLVSLVVNVLILPFVPFAMVLGFAAGIAGMLLPLFGKIIGLFAWALTSYQIWVAQYFASLKYASINVTLNLWAVAAIYSIILFVTFWGTRSLNIKNNG